MTKTAPKLKKEPKDEPQSFAKSLFLGILQEDMVFPFPEPKEEKETLSIILENLRKFAKDQIDPKKIDQEGKISKELLLALGELGIFGLLIPEKFGGLGLSQFAYARVFEEMGAIDGSLATTLGAHMSIGLKGLLLYGTEDQKQRYLPKLASGKCLAAFALTEPGAGSDAYSIQTRAVLQSDGSYLLNGSKIWITNGGIADFFTVFAKTEIESKGEKKDKVTAFIVTRDMTGFSSGKEEHKLGIRGSSTTEISFVNVKVPPENVLGEPGKGFKMAMEILNSGRLGLATGSVGGAKKLLRLAVSHATQRKQFGKAIAEFGLIQEKLGQMMIDIYATESAAYLTCGLVDQGVPDYSIESAICKVAGSEMLWQVANEATQIAGGASYMREYPYEQMLRDSRINMIFEGTNEILRCFVALSGMKGIGENLKLVGKALNDPIKSLGVLYDYFVTQKITRSLYGDQFTKAHPELKRETSMIEEHVQELLLTVEKAIRKHQKHIWEKQFVQKRIAEVAIDLYRMIAVVSRVTKVIEEKGKEKAESDIAIARTFCVQASRRIGRNFRDMDRNVDEYLKDLAKRACQGGGYTSDLFS